MGPQKAGYIDSGFALLRAVRFDVVFGRVLGVIGCMDVVPMREVRVVRRGFVVSVLMMFRGFAVMACGVLVVLRRVGVVLGCFVRHGSLLSGNRVARKDYREAARELGLQRSKLEMNI